MMHNLFHSEFKNYTFVTCFVELRTCIVQNVSKPKDISEVGAFHPVAGCCNFRETVRE